MTFFHNRLRSGVCSAALAFSLSPVGAALAQDIEDDDIIVTATKREQTLQDVPFSINAQTQEDIQRTGSQNLEDVARNVAGLTIQNLGPGQSQVAIRGVSAGQIVRDQPGVKEQVGVYLDESVISLSLFTPDLDLFDLARVETLRGPQGTLFGSGSIGGTIRYITNQPVLGESSGLFEGNFNFNDSGGSGGHGKGVVNVPLGDQLALRLVGSYQRFGGFIDALMDDPSDPLGVSTTENVNSGVRYGTRLSLRWEPFENLSITPRIVWQGIESDGFNRQEVFNLFANPFTTTRAPVTFLERGQFLRLDEEFTDETFIVDNKIEADLGGVTATSVTTFTEREILVSRDASALTGSVSVDLGFPEAGVLLPSNLRDTTDVRQWTQELRLANSGDDRLDWLVGFFFTDINRFYRQRLPTPGYDAFTDATLGEGTSAAVANGFGVDSPFNSDLPYDLQQFAFFGEFTYDITDRFHFTAGGRYYDFEEVRTITTGGLFAAGDSGTLDTTESSGFTPRFLLAYDLSDAITVNAQASQGFRLGGVNDPLNVALCSAEDEAIFGDFQDYDDETLWNFEAGVKAKTGGVTFNAAAFYSDISNLQVTLDAGSCSSRISFNVPDAHTLGLEWELGAELFTGLEVFFSGSWIESEFDSTVLDGNGNVLGGVQDGNRLASVPELQLSASIQHTFPLQFGDVSAEGFIAASAQHVGSRFTQPGDQVPGAGDFVSGLPFAGATGEELTSLDLELPDYQIVNLNAGLYYDNVEVIAYINNITDENALLSFDRERGGRARLGFRTNQPRTFGVTVRLKF
ncbi:MAG: TonB-dependent receptor [Pseudomonadota bacterium]